MPGLEVKSFDSPDETRPFEANGKLDVVDIAGNEVELGRFEPGWRWSHHVKPIVKTDSCEFHHLGYVLSGRMRIIMDDGTEDEIAAGDAFAIAPGHDAEVVGDEPCVIVDFHEASGYAKPA